MSADSLPDEVSGDPASDTLLELAVVRRALDKLGWSQSDLVRIAEDGEHASGASAVQPLTPQQYAFKDGHWVDQWNDVDDTTPRPDFTGGWPEAILPICGCGQPEVIVAALLEYMERITAWHERTQEGVVQIRPEHHLTDMLLAYLADGARLSEHGGSIFHCWPTDGGRRWMELARGQIGRGEQA